MAIVTKPLPIQLSNGSTADATQVMSLLNTIADSVNTSAAPLASPAFTGTINGASASFTGALSAASGAFSGDIQSASQNGGPLAGMRNRIINGNFQINQRVVSGTVTLAASAYGHDRWKAGSGGCTYTFATSGADTVITVTAGSLMQVIEGLNIEGGVYRLSQQGTSQARIAINGAATSSAYAANPQSSVSATGGQNVTIEFTTGTIDRVMFESGTTASTFERRQISYELAACQRYLPAFNDIAGTEDVATGYTFSTSSGNIFYQFVTEPRVPPTGISVSNPASFFFGNAASAPAVTSIAFASSGRRIARLTVAATGTSLVAQQPALLFTNTVGTQILFNGCEL